LRPPFPGYDKRGGLQRTPPQRISTKYGKNVWKFLAPLCLGEALIRRTLIINFSQGVHAFIPVPAKLKNKGFPGIHERGSIFGYSRILRGKPELFSDYRTDVIF
jgi:hypothetical protein